MDAAAGAATPCGTLTLDGSIRLMHTRLAPTQTLEQLLEQAKRRKKSPAHPHVSASCWRNTSTYMTRANKRKTLVLLYELLMHPDGDVRRIAGRIMGKILANAGPRYRKELAAVGQGRADAPGGHVPAGGIGGALGRIYRALPAPGL